MTVKRLIKMLETKCDPKKEIRILQYTELSPERTGTLWNLHLGDNIEDQEILVVHEPTPWVE